MVRAITMAWLFSGQRSDEIARLRVGCIRWQHHGAAIAGDSRQVLATDAVCLLDIPTHKTGTAFTKPVDPVLGQAIDMWQALRPAQPKFTERRTGERADMLFAIRAQKVSTSYINNTVIPLFRRKAGVPAADVRGNITSHRPAAVERRPDPRLPEGHTRIAANMASALGLPGADHSWQTGLSPMLPRTLRAASSPTCGGRTRT